MICPLTRTIGIIGFILFIGAALVGIWFGWPEWDIAVICLKAAVSGLILMAVALILVMVEPQGASD